LKICPSWNLTRRVSSEVSDGDEDDKASRSLTMVSGQEVDDWWTAEAKDVQNSWRGRPVMTTALEHSKEVAGHTTTEEGRQLGYWWSPLLWSEPEWKRGWLKIIGWRVLKCDS
jgi:hypothetical protein